MLRSELDQLPLSHDRAIEILAEARWAFVAHAELFNKLEAMRTPAGTPHATGRKG